MGSQIKVLITLLAIVLFSRAITATPIAQCAYKSKSRIERALSVKPVLNTLQLRFIANKTIVSPQRAQPEIDQYNRRNR